MTFKYRYDDDRDHTATFESATRAFDHLLMRAGLPNGPEFAFVYNAEDDSERYEIVPCLSFKQAYVCQTGHRPFFHKLGKLKRYTH